MLTDDQRRKAIRERVDYWVQRLKVQPPRLRVQGMKRKWGSCSTSGYITLASDLADQEPGFQDFVIAHELLHLRVPNHGKLFKALLAAHVPAWRKYDIEKQGAAKGTRFNRGEDSTPVPCFNRLQGPNVR